MWPAEYLDEIKDSLASVGYSWQPGFSDAHLLVILNSTDLPTSVPISGVEGRVTKDRGSFELVSIFGIFIFIWCPGCNISVLTTLLRDLVELKHWRMKSLKWQNIGNENKNFLKLGDAGSGHSEYVNDQSIYNQSMPSTMTVTYRLRAEKDLFSNIPKCLEMLVIVLAFCIGKHHDIHIYCTIYVWFVRSPYK